MNILSALSLLACAFYLESGFRVLFLDRKGRVNRLSFALYLDLALWAFAAAFIYGAALPETSRAWHLAFSPTWNLFFGFALHFCLLAAGRDFRLTPWRAFLLYAPGLFFTLYSNLFRLESFLLHGGYWMPVFRPGLSYWLFVAYYSVFLGLGLLALDKALRRSKDELERRRLGIFIASTSLPFVLGFLSDSVAPALGLDLPNLGILWIGIWAFGVRVAMTRYGFFAPVHEEIERRVRAEARLSDAGRLFDAFLENSLDGIVLTDAEGRVSRWSAAMERISGLPAASVVGRPIWEVQASMAWAGDREELERSIEAEMRKLLAGREAGWLDEVSEYRVRDGKGEEKYLQASSFVIPMSGGRQAAAAIVRDATERKRAETEALEELRRLDNAQKMEAVGTLAAGLAHDFNNILTGVLGTVSLLKLEAGEGGRVEPEELSSGLGIIETQASRAVEISRQLLDLTKRHPAEERPTSLGAAIQKAAALTRGSLDPAVVLLVEPPPPEAFVLSEGSELERVLINLILNSGEAMTSMRGPGEAPGGAVRVSVSREGSCWAISVKDEGVGIAREALARVFDPFYTTKGGGKSMGLGLSIVYNIAKRRGGRVEVDSAPGEGAEFRVYLPACAAP